jgi:hypothetical protein
LHQKLRIVLSAANQQQNPEKVVASIKFFAPALTSVAARR